MSNRDTSSANLDANAADPPCPAGRQPGIFTRHSRAWQNNSFVYPVVSRRSNGLSIGINLNPDRSCNFDCVYCSVDRSAPVPTATVDVGIIRTELSHLLDLAYSGELYLQPPLHDTPAALRRLNDIAFSGDGEPTACLLFEQAVHCAGELLTECAARFPGVKLILITNATLLHQPRVQQALRLLDHFSGEIWAKLDAGTDGYYRRIDRSAVPFRRVLDNILLTGRQRPIIIQSMFTKLHGLPPPAAEIHAYLDRLRDLRNRGCRIMLVQIYTVARHPAESFVTALEEPRLECIADGVRQLGIPATTFA